MNQPRRARAIAVPAPPNPRAFALLGAALLALLLAGVALLAPALPAHAHDYLVRSIPAEGEEFSEVPARIELEYSADIIPASPALLVTDAAGELVWEGVPDVEGRLASAPFPELGDGAYSLAWSLVSSDGHRVEGEIPFTMATGAPSVEPSPTPAPGTTPPDDAPSPSVTASPAAPPAPVTPSPSVIAAPGAAPSPDGTETEGAEDSGLGALPMPAKIAIGVGGIAAAGLVAVLVLRRGRGGLTP
ncbi:MAG: copper resistance protein CopC [bacterium]|nr:copper resistance protein CopC [bacterium]